jgi:hypothetical protein
MPYESKLARVQPIASNEGRIFQSLASKLQAFTNKQQTILDRDMEKKARQQGLIDAQGKTAITLKTGETIADEAWNEGATKSHIAAVKLDITENLSRIAAENPDPETFANTAKGYGRGLLDGVPEEMRPIVQDELSSMILKGRISADRNMRSAQQAEAKENILNALDLSIGQSLDATDSLNIDDSVKYQEEANELIDGAVAGRILTPAEGAAKKEEIADKIDEQLVIGQFKQALNQGNDDQFLKDFSAKEVGHFFDPRKREQLLAQMLTLRNHRDAISSIKKVDGKKQIAEFLRARSDGYVANSKEESEIRALAEDIEMSDELNKSIDDIDTVSMYGKTPASIRREKIAQYEKGGELEDYNKWKALKEADQRITKAAQQDGYALAVNQGIIEQTPVDYTNPATFATRNDQAKLLSRHYGVEVSPFTNVEVDQLIQATKEMTPQELTGLAESIGAMDNRKVLQEITKKQAPVFAMMAAVGDPIVSETVFTGQRELDLGNVKLPSGEDKQIMLTDLYDELKNVYVGEDLEAIRKSVFAHYAGTHGNQDYDDDVLKQSIKAITGGIATINNFSIELPRNVEADVMEDFIDEFSPEAVKHIGGVDNRTDKDAAKMIRDGIWRSVGSNQYAIITPFGELMQNGKPLRISYDPEIPKRKPPEVMHGWTVGP